MLEKAAIHERQGFPFQRAVLCIAPAEAFMKNMGRQKPG